MIEHLFCKELSGNQDQVARLINFNGDHNALFCKLDYPLDVKIWVNGLMRAYEEDPNLSLHRTCIY